MWLLPRPCSVVCAQCVPFPTHTHAHRYEPTNEMWWHEFAGYLASEFGDTGVDFLRDILPQMRQLILLSFDAARGPLWSEEGGGSGVYGHRAFNMFGFDFMIDENFKVCACVCWGNGDLEGEGGCVAMLNSVAIARAATCIILCVCVWPLPRCG